MTPRTCLSFAYNKPCHVNGLGEAGSYSVVFEDVSEAVAPNVSRVPMSHKYQQRVVRSIIPPSRVSEFIDPENREPTAIMIEVARDGWEFMYADCVPAAEGSLAVSHHFRRAIDK